MKTIDEDATMAASRMIALVAGGQFATTCECYSAGRAGEGLGAAGWVLKDLHCDYIAYAYLATKICYVIPFQQIRRAWEMNHEQWERYCKPIPVRNKKYTTYGIVVPLGKFLIAVTYAMWTTWDPDIRDGMPF